MLRRVLVVLAGVLVLGALGAGSASATLVYPLDGQLAPAGGAFGSLGSGSVAVDDANGSTYVADSATGVIDVFATSTGTQMATWSGSVASNPPGTPTGSLGGGEVSVAANNATGDVYVLDSTSGVVDVFSSAGAYVCQITGGSTPSASECNGVAGSGTPAGHFSSPRGIAVDQATGKVYVVDAENGVVDIFGAVTAGVGGAYLGQISLGSIPGGFNSSYTRGIAVDDFNGDVYVADSGPEVVYVFNGLGEWVTTWTGSPSGHFSGFMSVAADDTSGDVYVTGSYNLGITDVFDAAGEHIAQFGGSFERPLFGTAVDQASSRVYLSDRSVVDILGPAMVAPDAVTGSASNVLPASATLHGVVNPEGVPVTDCHFDYGTSVSYGQVAACVEAVGSGSGEVQVHADLSGLLPNTTYHFRLQASNANAANLQAGDETFITPGPPAVDEESASAITNHSAMLGAQVNPDALATIYRFEYGTTASYGTSAPVPDGLVGSGRGDEPVSAELLGLLAATTYHYRVVAVNSQGTVPGPDRTFTTLAPALIDGVSASELTAHSVTLNARIDPLGSETTYHFEWGTATSYGNTLPVPDAAVGSGEGDVAVSQHLTGIQPHTIYHYRVVATNARGMVRGVDHIFIYDTSGGGLPDNRAYELVSPPQKNAALIGDVFADPDVDISADGSRMVVGSIQCFAGAGSCTASRWPEGEPYAFTRTSRGWDVSALAPPADRFAANSSWLVSADAGTALFSMPTPPMGEDDWYAREPDGSFRDIGPVTSPALGELSVFPFASGEKAATADLSHVVWSGSDATTGNTTGLYEYAGMGGAAPVLVGVSGGAGSTDLISTCLTYLGSVTAVIPSYGSLSADGRTVYFTAQRCSSGSGVNTGVAVPGNALYARIDESRTVPISQSSPLDCTGMCQGSPAGNAEFQGASADGSKVFFTDTQQLTDNGSSDSQSGDTDRGCLETTGANGCNLYLYDSPRTPDGHNLIAVSAGDTSGGGPRVQAVMAISSDGSHVYFVAKGILSGSQQNSEGATATDGAENLYVFEHDSAYPGGRIGFIATLSASDEKFVGPGGSAATANASVTPDGRFLVFVSRGDLTRDDTSTTGALQVFRYDALSGELVRVSIGEHGFNDNGNAGAGNASIVPIVRTVPRAGPLRRDPTMSDDGAFVFFQSPIGLTPRALDDVRIGTDQEGKVLYAQNVYEYHEGHVYLISDGRDVSASGTLCATFGSVCLIGPDPTGANVFFTTADQLVGQDTDTQVDIYDARIGGGFPYAPSSTCEGEACHGTPASAPSAQASGSAVFSGAGNLAPPVAGHVVKAKKKKAKPGKARRRRAGHRKRGRRAAGAGRHVKRGGK